jgi:hypothetical protein
MATKQEPAPTTEVNIVSKLAHYWPREERNEEGEIVTPGVYAGLMVQADIRIGGDNRSGQHCVDVPEDASDEQIKAALLAQYGVV